LVLQIMRRLGMITPANENQKPINPEEGDWYESTDYRFNSSSPSLAF
jgi:hypothetical protein